MSRFWIVWAALTAAVLLPGPAPAGIVCLPGRIDDGRYVAGEQDAPLAYSILYSTITADASGGRLTVKVHETIAGPPQRRAVSGLIPLPKQADLGSVVVSAGQPNEPGRRRLAAVALDTTAAQRLYESVARQTGSTRILAWTGRPVLVVPELQLDGETELCCEFTASIAERDGLYGLTCPLPITAWASGPVERLSLAITVRGPQPLRTIFSPTHEVEVSRQGWREAAVRLKQDRWAGDDELRLLWVADRDPLGLRVLAYRAPEDEDGYFMLVGNPTGGEQAEQPLPKDVLFVLDISGSMRGEKLEQARAAIAYCLQQLQPNDRFNIIAFGTQVVSFQDAPAASSERLVAEAAVFLDELVATGRTNIEGALMKTLAGQAGDGRPRMAIFLTDGTPTAGELVPEKIVEQVQQANASNTRIFVLGVGHDVNAHLLDKLAEVTGGSSQYVEPNQEIDAQVAALYDRLAHPVLNDVAVDFGGLRTHSVYPQQLGVLFRGSEIMLAGRYRDGGPHEFSISGTLAGRAIKYGCRVDLPIRPGEAEYEFVAPLWAARKIGYLLQELRLHGQNQELIAEVVRLSKQFGIVTEYTQFLAESGGTFTTEAAVAQARVQLEQANVQQAGQWAVNQAFNDQGLQTRKVAGNAANTYRDRRGNVVGADSVKQIGGRVFYLRDGQWIDGDEAGNRQQRVVKLFSPEYFDLLRANADFARAQQLGWAMSLNVGPDRIVVEKDGRQQDEQLRQQAIPQPGLNQAPPPDFQQRQQLAPQQLPQLQQMPQRQLPDKAPIPQVQIEVPAAEEPAAGMFRNQLQRGNQRLPRGASSWRRPIHEPFVEPVTAAKIRLAIDDAVMFLRSRQASDGGIEGSYRLGGGTALAALTMLAAGVDPLSDPQLKSALDWLAKLDVNDTYVRAIRANVWEYALRKAPDDGRLRALLETDFKWLLGALGDKPGWRYQYESRDWDNSCTQYGVLGIWAAARAGFDPGEKFWQTLSRHFRGCQNADGGWGYTAGSGSTANMATAGLASLFLVFDMHHGRMCYSAENPRTFTSGEAAEVLASLERGMTWLGQCEGSKDDGYYLYGIERTGVASGRKLIGGEDWFARGALSVLRSQQPDGSIPLGTWSEPVVSTAFCTLFLVYGGAPVATAKLQYGPGHDWNLNPRDLANLSKELWSVYERPLNWQTVSIDETPEQYEAPLLWITGSQPASFTAEQSLRLRRYVQQGGTIVAEPSDHSPRFAASMSDLLRQMFPEKDYPGYQLRPLPPDHDVLTVIRQRWKQLPRLQGASDDSRTFFIVSQEYLSGDWQMNRTGSDAFKLATNLLFYATDLGTLDGKFASILPDSPAAPARSTAITVARVQHSVTAEAPRDWDAAAACWQMITPYVRHVTGGELNEAQPVVLGRDPLDGIRLLHVTGRTPAEWTAGELAALKRYVEQGGTVLVDAWAGSSPFADSTRSQLEAAFGRLEPLPAEHLLASGLFQGGVDLADAQFKLEARRLLRSRGQTPRGQRLLVAMVGRRPAVIYSEFDLCSAMAGIASYRALGYQPESARRIIGNLMAYLDQKRG